MLSSELRVTAHINTIVTHHSITPRRCFLPAIIIISHIHSIHPPFTLPFLFTSPRLFPSVAMWR